MRRRGAGGMGAIQKQQLEKARFRDKGSEIADDQLQQMTKQMDSFRSNLQEFASKYKNKIKKNPEFRRQFQEMCAATGVDPLASSKGFWANLLGVGDFYYEIGVQIVEVCLATRHRNGGVMVLEELRQRLVKARAATPSQQEDIGYDDIIRAIAKLRILGEGFRVIENVGAIEKSIVQAVPGELSMDQTTLLQLASRYAGCVRVATAMKELNWEPLRMAKVIGDLIREGLLWVDEQEAKSTYWFPGLFKTNV